jgi:hypothetical protein
MVIHQEKNTQIEQVAKHYATQLFERQGYRITKKIKGCDFVARKRSEVIPVEVKGRSKLINFTNMSKAELRTLQEVSNARVILVYVDVKDKPQALIHLTLTKDDIASVEISTYRVKWKVPLEKAVMEEMRRAVEQKQELIKSYEEKLPVGKS